MLQIITGKFYGEALKHNNKKTVTLYSNAKLLDKCSIGHFHITPIEYDSDKVNAYKVEFNNQIEQMAGGFSLVDVGSDVVVYQLKNILTFYLDCYFDDDEHIVSKMCVQKQSRTRTKSVPSNFLRTTLDNNKEIGNLDIDKSNKFLFNLVALKRVDYQNVMSCIRSYCASIRLLEEDPNLAYCMLIFALESLSQNYDKYEPIWNDYNENIHDKIEKVLKNVNEDEAQAIRNILASDSHLKLTQRFLNFIISNITDDFYFGECLGSKILKDDITFALKNAYNIRSKYAHNLKIIIDQSTTDDSSKASDYYKHLHEPYFTYSGLLRLTRHVIINFIDKLEKIDKEPLDWTAHIPGTIEVVLGPQFWLSKMESPKCLGAKKRFEGFVSELSGNIAYDIKAVMDMYITQFPTLKIELKKPIFSLCVLWNQCINHEPEYKEKYNNFIENNKSSFNDCCIENIAMYTFPYHETYSIEWDNQIFEKTLFDYILQKHKFNQYLFPSTIETLMYLFASEFFNVEEIKRKYWKDKARYNSANDNEILDIVNSDMPFNEKTEKIWTTIYSRKK